MTDYITRESLIEYVEFVGSSPSDTEHFLKEFPEGDPEFIYNHVWCGWSILCILGKIVPEESEYRQLLKRYREYYENSLNKRIDLTTDEEWHLHNWKIAEAVREMCSYDRAEKLLLERAAYLSILSLDIKEEVVAKRQVRLLEINDGRRHYQGVYFPEFGDLNVKGEWL